jgi:enterochelin esterase-like enzyme
MTTGTDSSVARERREIASALLNRVVKLDIFLPRFVEKPGNMPLLIINDGQDMEALQFHPMLEALYAGNEIRPVLSVAVHAGEERKMEYGTCGVPDYKGRGAKAEAYAAFIFTELIPFICNTYLVPKFKEKMIAGFSLGGLSALDMAWTHPGEFSKVGVFSGSLWWRLKGLEDDYDDNLDRIMPSKIRQGRYQKGLKFFFQTGTEDETADRNNNGIIDSIDDTMAVIEALVSKGYKKDKDVVYLELEGGKHDVPTWGKAMPHFLRWAFGFKV